MAQASRPPIELAVPQSIGERIGLLRRRARISQNELARRAGILLGEVRSLDHSTLSQFESGRRRPSLVHLWAIAHVLDVKVSDLGATETDYPELGWFRDPKMTSHIRWSAKSRSEQQELFTPPT